MYEFLRFYNNNGEYTNFSYDSSLDKWTGRIDMHTISVDLIENFDLFLVEEVWDDNSNKKTWAYPHGLSGVTGINASFNKKVPVPEIFVYSFETGPTSSKIIELNKTYSIDYDFDISSDVIAGPTAPYPGIKETTLINSSALPIHIGFMPSQEDGYTSILTLKDNTDHVVAEITIYGEGEEEDERLRTLLINIGHDLLPEDSLIFDTSNVNEESIDWNLINRKRKELLLEYENIFPYLGSYKALINIIKFYGYQNVHMKEYWKNVDVSSPNYLKYRQVDVKDIFTEDASFSDTSLIPSKVYRKTSKFGLFYDINVESGEFDSTGLPITEEVFNFSPEEILIKIYALKKKLQNYFLPVNSKIVDIIGEALYFAQYKIGMLPEQNRIDSVSLGITPKISVSPGPTGYIEDLRPLYYLGFPIGPDLNAGGYTDIWSYRVEIDNTSSVNTGQTINIRFDFEIGGTSIAYLDYDLVRDPNNGQIIYTQNELATKISKIINDPLGTYIHNTSTGSSGSSYVFDNFFAYAESDANYIRIIQKVGTNLVDSIEATFTSTSVSPYAPSNQHPNNNTAPYIDASLGGTLGASGAPMSYYTDAFLGYFDKSNLSVQNLNDDEDIPLGYPIVLHNDTFDIDWDDAKVTYNQLDSINPGSSGPNANTLYSSFNISYNITGWNSVSTPIISTVPGFPSTYFPNQNSFSWINLGYYGYYDMQWIIKGPRNFIYDSTQKSIEKIKDISVILPYVGSYSVELYLWDLYNNRSMLYKTDFIDVKIPHSDFIGWYQKRELDYKWNTREYPKQSIYKNDIPPIGNPLRKELTWDDYASTWDLPLHPNENIEMLDISSNSLDSIEFYQTIYNPIENPLVDKHPFNFNLLGNFAQWKDTYHLWWDNTGTRVTQFEIPSDLATKSDYTGGPLQSTTVYPPFDRSLAINGMTLVALPALPNALSVSDNFVENVARCVELILDPDAIGILYDKQAAVLQRMQAWKTIQRIGYVGMGEYSPALSTLPGWDATNDDNTNVDFVWELSGGSSADQITEVLEHVLHTITTFGLPGAYPNVFNQTSAYGPTYTAMTEAINNGVFDTSGYSQQPGETLDEFNALLMREYLYLLIYAEWDFITTYVSGGTLAPEWTATTPALVATNNPLGHALYTDYISKLLAKPSTTILNSMFMSGGVSGYVPFERGTGFVDLFMTRENSNVDKTSYNISYVEGPTGWTGPTASGSGATGDYTYVNSGNRVYQYDGNEWKNIYETIDGVKIPLSTGTLSDSEKLKEICDYLNKIQIDESLDPNSDHDIFNDFIYYYNEEYDSSYALVPYIRAVSKNFDKQGRHTIYSDDSSQFKESSYETVNFGYLGDIPTHFEIFELPTDLTNNPSITIKYITGGNSMTSPYLIGSTSLSDLVDELNGPTAQNEPGIGDFTYNLVMGASGWTGGTGPSSSIITEVKLQGIHKAFSSNQEIEISFDGILGTSCGRSLIKNPTWDSIRVLKYTEELPLLTVVNLTYDNSEMKGKKNPKWTLIKEDDNNFGNIYYNNKYFSYMFTERGSYTIILELEDTNGNKTTVKKQEIIKII